MQNNLVFLYTDLKLNIIYAVIILFCVHRQYVKRNLYLKFIYYTTYVILSADVLDIKFGNYIFKQTT